MSIFLYEVDFDDGAMIGSLSEEVVANIATLLYFYATTVTFAMFPIPMLFFKLIGAHRVINLFRKTGNLETNLTSFKEGIEHIFSWNLYQLCGTFFDNLDLFDVPYSDTHKLFNKMAIFVQSICVEDGSFKDTETGTWFGKHIPISLSISPNLIQKAIFFCDPNPRDLVSSSYDSLGIWLRTVKRK